MGRLTQTPAARSAFLCLGLTLLALSPVLHAAGEGSISGTVKDHSGAVIPKASVIATNRDTDVRQTIATNASGVYSFPGLAVGRYDVDIMWPVSSSTGGRM